MTKVLITGGAGFIGYHLARRFLADGHHVVIIDNFSRGVLDPFLEELRTSGADVRNVDLLSCEALESIETDFELICHLAAIIGVANVLERPFSVLRDNAVMSLNVIELARRQRHLKRFLFPSTSEVYAGTLLFFDLQFPTPEDTPLAITPLEHSRTSYMLSKIYGEALCQHAGIPFTIIRPHNVYGPRMGMAHVVPELLKKAVDTPAGGRLEVFSVQHKRTFCFVDDAVEMIVRLMTKPEGENGTFNIGSLDREISIEELAKVIIKVVGKDLEIKALDETSGSPTRRQPDMVRTMSATGMIDFLSLEDGVRRCYEWYREHLFEGTIASAQ